MSSVLGAVLVVALAAVGLANVVHTTPTTTLGPTTSLGSTTTRAPVTTTTTLGTRVSLAAVGDTELGNTPQLPADAATYFNPVRAALATPIVFGNLEGTFTNATTSKCAKSSTDCYAFKVPPSYALIYRRAGFTVLNSANNHSDDFGGAGLADTSAAMRAAGITQAGLPGQIGVVREGALRVAFVDFAPYGLTNNLLDGATATALIERASRLANVVVVYMHAGAEGANADHVTRHEEFYVGEDRGNPYAFAHLAVNAGADLVIASGPHVLRGLEWYRGHLIDYSLGDFANYEDFSASGSLALSAILHVTLSASGGFVAGHFSSVVLAPSGAASLDSSAAAASFVNALSRADFGAHAALIAPDGSIAR
ncbi:MAG: CapA family protein [Acidobacteriota bacterium]|nr:CapA family protein [Acidobacteriota bacterium]